MVYNAAKMQPVAVRFIVLFHALNRDLRTVLEHFLLEVVPCGLIEQLLEMDVPIMVPTTG
jgi:hypothetical protein